MGYHQWNPAATYDGTFKNYMDEQNVLQMNTTFFLEQIFLIEKRKTNPDDGW